VSTEELRRELARIGDTAPVAEIPADTFSRAQRARRRDRLAVVAGAAAAVAIVVGLVAWLPDRSAPQPADSNVVGVPDVIHAVPAGALKASDDLAVGQAAVALTSEDGLPVVIDAEDGTYRALDLPGFGSMQTDQGSLALSPDGRQLAWAWADPSTKAPTPTGVRIVDLVTGEERSMALTGGQGVFVDRLTWSPNSRWLLWTGANAWTWTESAYRRGEVVAGRIGPDATSSEPVPAAHDEMAQYAVSDDGEVATVTTRWVVRWDGQVIVRKRVGSGDDFTGSVVDASGTVPVSASYWMDEVWALRRSTTGHRQQLLVYTTTASRAYGDAEIEVPLDPQLGGRGVVPLGWIDSSHFVARTAGAKRPDGTRLLSDLTVLGVGDHATYDVEGSFDEGVPPVSLATDLAQDPLVSRPMPDWANPDDGWSDAQISIAIGLGVAGVLALLEAWRWWWRRRRLPLR
jgi:hypothetical protein